MHIIRLHLPWHLFTANLASFTADTCDATTVVAIHITLLAQLALQPACEQLHYAQPNDVFLPHLVQDGPSTAGSFLPQLMSHKRLRHALVGCQPKVLVAPVMPVSMSVRFCSLWMLLWLYVLLVVVLTSRPLPV